jgi:glutathione S-transferase
MYKLTYFDFDGGRAEPIRIAFHMGGIEFEDNRITFPQFGEIRSKLRFNAVPVLEIEGVQVTQSNAIGRYVALMAGLYPDDNLQALYCDEVTGALEDIDHYVVQTFGLEGEALRTAREILIEKRLSVFLRGLDELLTRGGGTYFAGNQLTIADLKAFCSMRSLSSGKLDHIPASIVQEMAPGLSEHQKRISLEPGVVAYYASRTKTQT